jgi:glutathione S-transferase
VPILVDGSLSVHESLAISEYVAELYPEPKLWPEDRKLRARGRAIARIPSLDHPLMDGTDGVIVRRADWLSFSFSRIHNSYTPGKAGGMIMNRPRRCDYLNSLS